MVETEEAEETTEAPTRAGAELSDEPDDAEAETAEAQEGESEEPGAGSNILIFVSLASSV